MNGKGFCEYFSDNFGCLKTNSFISAVPHSRTRLLSSRWLIRHWRTLMFAWNSMETTHVVISLWSGTPAATLRQLQPRRNKAFLFCQNFSNYFLKSFFCFPPGKKCDRRIWFCGQFRDVNDFGGVHSTDMCGNVHQWLSVLFHLDSIDISLDFFCVQSTRLTKAKKFDLFSVVKEAFFFQPYFLLASSS